MKAFKEYIDEIGEIGFVSGVVNVIAYVDGLPNAALDELVLFESGETGRVMSVKPKRVEVLILSKNNIVVGTRVARTHEFLEIPVGPTLLGNVVDCFGNSIDSTKIFEKPTEVRSIENAPPDIISRKTIKKTFYTGVTIVDLLAPLGRGQRELVIGDRKTGKTSFLLHSAIAAVEQGNICIYAAIGKKKLDVKRIEEFFIENKVMDKVIIVASTPEDPPGEIFITPYTAMTIAEYFKDQGQDTLVIMDDLSTHAKFYREISLLARRFPGRNSYPGDMFYVHARLLERAGNFEGKNGDVAITCLPVVETLEGDLSGYIQTNIMSMTDGHIYFDRNLFAQGRRPSVNPFLSVTRVGRQTQTNTKRNTSRELLAFLTLYEKMVTYSHFGAELTESARITIDTGKKILALFDQDIRLTIPNSVQIMLFCLIWGQIFTDAQIEKLTSIKTNMTFHYNKDEKYKAFVDNMIEESKTLNDLLNKVRTASTQLMQLK